MLEETIRDVTLEPLDDWIVVEPLDDSETASGLIVPINEGAQTRQAIVAAVGPDVESIDPGDKVLFPRDAGFEVRLARSAHRVRMLKRACVTVLSSDRPAYIFFLRPFAIVQRVMHQQPLTIRQLVPRRPIEHR